MLSSYALWVLVGVAVADDQFRSKLHENQEKGIPIVKSASDDREYLGLELSNKLRVLLISDPKTGSAAASMDVAVGYMADPESMPGLAHFCEHMLFMGNNKYPNASSYFAHLQSNGGQANARTSYDSTNFFFSVNHGSLESTLDRFSQFFISPLFPAESVENEAKAVNSEHQLNLRSDLLRAVQVQKYTLNQSHPFSHFSTGNYNTLSKIPKENGTNPRLELIKYFDEYYSANQMQLVVLGRESLEQLKNMATHIFSNVRNSNRSRPSIPFSPFSKDNLGIEIAINPTGNTQKIILQFPLPSQAKHYREKPIHLISHLIGHRGTGSITEHLTKEGWATFVSAGLTQENVDFSVLDVGVELTPLGLEKKYIIVQLILEYVELIKRNDTKKYFDELASINEIKFRFQERTDPSNYASSLASAMKNPNPLSETLPSQTLMTRFDRELVEEMLSYINKDNLRLSIVANITDAKLKEPWFDTKYNIKKLPQLNTTRITLQLPPTNTYIPNNFDLINTPPQIQRLRNTSQCILWHAGNPTKTPKVTVHMLLKNSMATRTPDLFAKLNLMVGVIDMQLNVFAYNAQLADLSYNLIPTSNGLVLKFYGYNQKMELFISDILDRIKNIEISESAFKVYKKGFIRDAENTYFDTPANQGLQILKVALIENAWTWEMLLSALAPITHSQLSEFTKHMLSSAKLEMLVVGNMDQNSTNHIMDTSLKTLQLVSPSEDLLHPIRSIILPQKSFVAEVVMKNQEESNSANIFYLDMYAYTDPVARASTHLLGQMLYEPTLTQLRVNEQLGYLTSARMLEMNSRGGLVIEVQSERDPSYLESRIENLLQSFQRLVERMPEEEFQNHVNGLKSSILGKQRNLQETADFYWEAIHSGFYDFDRGNI
ncbi:metalloprotease [Entomophthora muscae]|uniref:Metalloprotease n=1 Tax=Entomophthora muscae TaxID=34485 RepID=A0ACC2US83_9FUNG|nr:metalloprotease [Entomophthora muscae]